MTTLSYNARSSHSYGNQHRRSNSGFSKRRNSRHNEPSKFALVPPNKVEALNITVKPWGDGTKENSCRFTLIQEGREVGMGRVNFHYDEEYSFLGKIPPGTATMDLIEIDEHERGKGLGKYLLKAIEDDAKRRGMKRVWTLFTMSPGFFEGGGYRHIRGRLYEKALA